MPSLVGHFAIPLAVRVARELPAPLIAAGLVASMLPDADTLGLLFGIAPGTVLAHRGATHSLAFAAVVATLAAVSARRLRTTPRRAFAFVLLCALSHPLLDTLTDGGPGVMLGWRFATARVFAAWRPIAVSPIGIGFFSARGLVVAASALLWIALPASVLVLLARIAGSRRA